MIASMQERQSDPFFEQLKADVQEGIEAADRVELVDAPVFWEELRLQIDEVERSTSRWFVGNAALFRTGARGLADDHQLHCPRKSRTRSLPSRSNRRTMHHPRARTLVGAAAARSFCNNVACKSRFPTSIPRTSTVILH